VRIRGNSSRTFSQKSYAFELRQEGADVDDDRSVVGLPSDSDWNLIAPSRPDRSLVRNVVAFTLSNEIQRYAPRARMVEVFTVESGAAGTVGRSSYKGVFTLTEKIKGGKNRIRISAISPEARNEPDISGGYVFKIDHPQGFAHWRVNGICHCVFDQVNNMPFQLVDPDWDVLPGASRTAFAGYLRGYLQEFFDAVRAPDFKHPGNGKSYTEYIDVPAFIDHNLLNAVFKNVDSLRLSAYFYKDRGGKIAAGPLWDMDLSSGTPFDDQFGRRTSEAREWARGDGTDPIRYAFWGRLYADPVYRAAHHKRWQELAAGPLSVAHVHEMIDKFAA
jgi:CotH kinase protein